MEVEAAVKYVVSMGTIINKDIWRKV
jgi:uncharacterized membrane protein